MVIRDSLFSSFTLFTIYLLYASFPPSLTKQSAEPVSDAIPALKELAVLAGAGCLTSSEGYIILKQTRKGQACGGAQLRLQGCFPYVPGVCGDDWQEERERDMQAR